jgi:hypothetical protein
MFINRILEARFIIAKAVEPSLTLLISDYSTRVSQMYPEIKCRFALAISFGEKRPFCPRETPYRPISEGKIYVYPLNSSHFSWPDLHPASRHPASGHFGRCPRQLFSRTSLRSGYLVFHKASSSNGRGIPFRAETHKLRKLRGSPPPLFTGVPMTAKISFMVIEVHRSVYLDIHAIAAVFHILIADASTSEWGIVMACPVSSLPHSST